MLGTKTDVITIFNDESPTTFSQTFEDSQITIWERKINQHLQATHRSLMNVYHQIKLTFASHPF